VARYTISAESFDFGNLESRLTPNLQANFSLLLEDLAQFAPHAGLNRGAYLATQGGGELFKYPSKHAFYEELVWMLWRISQAKSLTES